MKPLSSHIRPVRIASAEVTVRDLSSMVAFYQYTLGLSVHDRAADRAILGAPSQADDAGFLTLVEDRGAAPDRRDQPGLFHIAYLLPSQGDLAAWLAARRGAPPGSAAPLTGASDHGVSQAIYLDDPEGNGLEIYADREESVWPRFPDGRLAIGNARLDLDALARSAEPTAWREFPELGRIGHVHLRVADLSAAARFWTERIGLEETSRMTEAVFLGAGGYHHHIAVNTWFTAGAAPRAERSAGLSALTLSIALSARAALATAAAEAEITDPCGVRIRFAERPVDA